MKKFALALTLLLLVPFQAMALQALDEGDMGAITGQAGVSIAIDDVMIYQNIEYLRYTDNDGAGAFDYTATPPGYTPGTAGSIQISNLYMMVYINGITRLEAGLPFSPNRAVQGTYNTVDQAGNPIVYTNGKGATGFEARALTIDAGTMPILSAGLSNNLLGASAGVTVAGVKIGLPTVEVHQSALSFDVTVTSTGAANTGKSYGNIAIGRNTMTVLDGWIEIAPH